MACRRLSLKASSAASSAPVGSPSSRRLGRQQQLRLEKGEPRRHDQIVGGDLEPEPPRLGDEVEILLGERQHRNLGEIDLLGAGQRQQQVERSLEAFDIDHELIAGLRLERLRPRSPNRRSGRVPADPRSSASRCRSCLHRRVGTPARHLGAGSFRHQSHGLGDIERLRRVQARRGRGRSVRRPTPSSERHRVARPRPSRQGCRRNEAPRRSRPRSRRAARSANEPPRAFMPRSSLITKPVRPIRFRITSPIITGEVLAGRRSSKAGNRTWAVMAKRRVAEGMERPEIDRIELRRRHVDPGQRQMAVGLGPAVARHMLDHRQHAAGETALHHGPSERDDDVGIGSCRRGRR